MILRNATLLIGFGLMAVMGSVSAASAAVNPFIAGENPTQRPIDAPVVREMKQTEMWRNKALSGVARPYPLSVTAMLKDQGAWYTPFMRAGMVGSYDIRGWHRK